MSHHTKFPTIIIVPGAFHTPAHWESVTKLLTDASFNVVPLHLPSVGHNARDSGLLEDIEVIRLAIKAEITNGHNVILVVHSAGGVAGCAALDGLINNDEHPGVVRIVGVACFLIDAGTSLVADGGGGAKLANWYTLKDEMLYPKSYDDTDSPVNVLYNDCTEEVKRKAFADLQPQSLTSMKGVVRYAGWRYVSLTYVVCEQDKTLPAAAQEMLVKSVPIELEVVRLRAGHSPFLSMPENIAEVIKEAAGSRV